MLSDSSSVSDIKVSTKTSNKTSCTDDDNNNIILDKIPTNNKGFMIPHEYIVLKKSVLKDLLYDQQTSYNILLKMLPEHVIKALNRGETIVPEEFDSVTIFFSDIIGFTEIAAQVDHLLVVKLLNQLYSVMDHCASYFPLFKIETIGDAYMIVRKYTIHY